MKHLILTFFAIFCTASLCMSQKPKKYQIIPNTHDFGTIKEDTSMVSYDFGIKNTGDSALVIRRVTASCGCTTPEWTKEAILPGQSGTIKVKYSTIGRPGEFVKTIYVYTSASDDPSTLVIKGNVIGNEALQNKEGQQ